MNADSVRKPEPKLNDATPVAMLLNSEDLDYFKATIHR